VCETGVPWQWSPSAYRDASVHSVDSVPPFLNRYLRSVFVISTAQATSKRKSQISSPRVSVTPWLMAPCLGALSSFISRPVVKY
jgi:hypothetical protein